MQVIRGAINSENTKEDIIGNTKKLMLSIAEKNNLKPKEVSLIMTTCTNDLTKSYPGDGIRQAGFDVPIICVQEQYVENSLPKTIRLVVLCEIDRPISHVYIGKTADLRKDLFSNYDNNN